MKKRIISLFLCAAMTLSGLTLSGCSATVGEPEKKAEEPASVPEAEADDTADEKQNGEETEGKQEFVGFSVQMMNAEFFVDLSNRLKAKCEEAGMKFEVASADGQASKQVEQIENFASMGVTTLVVMPMGPEIQDALKKVRDKGIRVIIAGAVLDKDSYDIATAVDQYLIGENSAKMAAEWIEKTFPDAEDKSVEVVLLQNTTSEENIARTDGLKQIESLSSKAKLVESYEVPVDASSAKVQEYMDMVYGTHPDTKVVLAFFQAYAVAADESVMRNPSIQKDQFAIFSCDWGNEIGERMKTSVDNESVIRGTIKYGNDLPETIMQAIRGELTLDENNVCYDPVYSINVDNVEEYLCEFQGN